MAFVSDLPRAEFFQNMGEVAAKSIIPVLIMESIVQPHSSSVCFRHAQALCASKLLCFFELVLFLLGHQFTFFILSFLLS